MTGNKLSMAIGWTDPDDAPDLSAPEYRARLAATPVKRGRPKALAPKVRIGFRLSPDVIASIRASGKGYNARVEAALRAAFFKPRTIKAVLLTKSKSVKKIAAARKRRLARRAAKRPAIGKRA